jgi:flagellar hook-associated protein 2
VSITPLRFSGVSSFSADLEQILSRAVAIAELPIRQLQSDQARLLSKKQSLATINTQAESLQSAVKVLGELGSNRSLGATSSNTTRVSIQLNGAPATPNTYTITEIASVAKKASETSLTGFATADATAVDDDGQLELVLGGETFAIDLTDYGNTLDGLRDAINAAGVGVTATVLDTGTGATPHYLSITASATGATTLELRTTAGSAASNILTAANQGANAVFKLNGLDVSKADNVITDVIPGVTFTILDTTEEDETITLSLASSRSSLATALETYVTAYNSVVDQVNAQIGDQAGLLSGDTIVRQTQQALRDLSGYFSGGAVRSLADLGVEIDKSGVASFDSTQFYALPTSTIDAAFEFLGSSSTGFGALASRLDQITNPVTGLVRLQQDNYDAADSRLNTQIEDITRRIDTMRASLSLKLQQADALLSQLQGQQAQLTTILESLSRSQDDKS